MPKKAKELSALAVARLKAEGRYAVGGADGLHLRIAGASRAWVLRVAVGTRTNSDGKSVVHRRDVGLGSYPEVSLAEAREKARGLRKQVRNGIDPIEERRATKARERIEAAKAKTFKECAEKVIEKKGEKLRNAKALAQWESTLETYAYPILNDGRKVAELTKYDVKAVLEPIWHTKRETASRLRGRIEAVFNYAKAVEAFEGDNPAAWKGCLEPLLGEQKQEGKQHHPALPHKRIGAFMTELRKREGVSARALEFAILTAARSGEVRGATWDEIDLKAETWTIPKERMKANREHVVTLSDTVVKLLKSLPRIVGTSYVFPAPRGGKGKPGTLSDMALTAVVRRMHEDDTAKEGTGWTDVRSGRVAVVHGFRSTFRDWTAEIGYDRDMAEMALAHTVGSEVERAYRRTDMVERRRALMQDWANYCAKIAAGNVVELKQGAA
ncbi:MAG: integrase arm-type DNA-binding domain-containing protein [Burkholderiales bacterium]|nr:integrase arm-type DNA-binding domain-containing protein [Burkholderiales bacterium]OJX00136.1 MAG: integrase [Burkholderiales bacterium 70-64]